MTLRWWKKGEADECLEEDLVEAMKLGHEAIKVQIAAQERLAELVGEKALVKRTIAEVPAHEELKKRIEALISDDIYALARSASDKDTRKTRIDEIKEAAIRRRQPKSLAKK